MAILNNPTVSELLYWSYANLAMAEKAVHARDASYTRIHYMIRSRLYSGLKKGTMLPRSLMLDQRVRMTLPQECVYCSETANLAVDHVVPTHRGGADAGDNAIWACRKCNSSKSGRDLFEWWFSFREGFPPLFVVRIYLKQAIAYFHEHGLLAQQVDGIQGSPFSLAAIPTVYPPPATLTFSPFHASRQSTPE